MKIIVKVYRRSKKNYFDREIKVDFFADPDIVSIWMDKLRLHIDRQLEGIYVPQHPEYDFAEFQVSYVDGFLVSDRVKVGDLVDKIEPKVIKMRVENYFGYHKKDNQNQGNSEVMCRYWVYMICILKTTLNLKEIGFLYRQDYTTVIHGRKTIINAVETNRKDVTQHLAEIERLFGIGNLKERILNLNQ